LSQAYGNMCNLAGGKISAGQSLNFNPWLAYIYLITGDIRASVEDLPGVTIRRGYRARHAR
jgi:hypothetical protein